MEISKFEDINFAEFGKREKQYEKKIADILKKTLDDIRQKMAMIYEKYAKDGILTKADMTRYNRLVSLEKNIVDLVRPGIKQAQQIVDRLRPEEYSEGFFRSGWSIDEASKVSLNWAPVNKDLITKSLDNTFFHTASKLFSQKSLSRIQNAINQGLIDGKSYATMIKDLKTALNQSNYEIMRWLRTEMGAAYSAGSSDAYDSALKQGIQGNVIWDAALDGRTRPTHAGMDGMKRKSDGLFHGSVGVTPYPRYEGMPAGERINCRCSIRFEIEGMEPELRRTKDGGVKPYQDYDEWSRKNGEIKEVKEIKSEIKKEIKFSDLQKESIDKMTKDGEEAYHIYVETGAFDRINKALRYGDELDNTMKNVVKNLSNAIDNGITSKDEIVVYRGISQRGLSWIDAKLKPGAVFKDKAFLSTSFNKEKAKEFITLNQLEGETNGALMEIRIKPGTKFLASPFKRLDEEELLFNKNSKMRVISREGGNIILEMIQ